MLLSDFDYFLPPELIASHPLEKRSASRLLYLKKTKGVWQDMQFSALPDLLKKGDLLVFNNTKVVPARLYGHKQTGGKIEVLIERIVGQKEAWAHIRASKAPRCGAQLILENALQVEVSERHGDLFKLVFHQDVLESLEQFGHIPLPSYLQRDEIPQDRHRYQTIYAKEKGAVAAPTAGLHFDEETLQALNKKGIQLTYLTLHVGAGTFQPVRVTSIENHKMHSEYMVVSKDVVQTIQKVKQEGGRIIAVGTTSARALETAARGGQLLPYQGETDIFIYPGFQFQCIDGLLTNFHLPKSTLLMLVCALGGHEQVMGAYHHAVEQKYRFYSYGDCMLLL